MSSIGQSSHFSHAESSTHVPSRDDESTSHSPVWAMSDIASGHHLSNPKRGDPRPTQHSLKSELTKSPDFRILRRSPELPCQLSSSSSTLTQPAISASYNIRNIISSSQDVPPVVNSSAFLSSPVTRTDAFQHYLGPSVSSSPTTPSNHVLTHRRQRPRTSNQVFTAPHGKIAPYGIPKSLPPAPSTAPRRTQTAEPEQPDFTTLSNNYLNMLAHQPTDNNMDADITTTVAPNVTSPFAPEDVQNILDVITASSSNAMPPPPTPQTPELWSSPAWSDANDFGFSPDTDYLNTPLFGDNDDMLTGMFNDADFEGGALFPTMEGFPGYDKPLPSAPPTLPDNLITMTPESPALHDFNVTVNPSSLYPSPRPLTNLSFPSTPAAAPIQDFDVPVVSDVVPAPVVQKTVPAPRRKSSPNGTRKGVTPEALVPIDAPTQPRKYILPSATSKKDLPSVFVKKRSRSTAFGEEEEEFNEPPPGPDATEREQIEYKRRQNTVAARRSRKRKLEYQRGLEADVQRVTRQRDVWKERAKLFQSLLQANGVQIPPFSDDIEDY